MTRNDPDRYRQSLEDWRWLTAEAEAADRRAIEAERERRDRPEGATAFIALCIAVCVAIPGAVLALMKWGWI